MHALNFECLDRSSAMAFLLQRVFSSVFSGVYAFTRLEPHDGLRSAPETVRTDMPITILLAPLLAAGLDRTYAAEIIASDASSS